MHILFFNRSFYPDVEATGQLLTELCQDLSRQHQITVVAGRSYNTQRFGSCLPVKSERFERVRVLRAYNPRFNKTSFAGRVLNLLSYFVFSFAAGFFSRRPDVVVAETDPPVLGLVGLFFARWYGAKFVFYLQDLYPDVGVALGQLKNRWLIWLLEFCTQRTLAGADKVVVLAEDMQRRVAAKRTLQGHRVHIIPNWVDTGRLHPLSRSNLFRNAHGLGGDFVVMFSGNLGLSQRLDMIIDVASQLVERSRIRFVLIGEGAAKERLEQSVKSRGLQNVSFLPYQPKERLSESLSAADVHLVTLSRGVAGLIVPSKVYGIMAAGRPFIAAIDADSHIAGLAKQHGCGMCVEPDSSAALRDAIVWAFEHRPELEEMGRRGRQTAVECFDRRISVAKCEALLGELAVS